MFLSFQFPLKTLARSDKITWVHKPDIAQSSSRPLKRRCGCFLIYTAPSGFPLCCFSAARCPSPAGIRSAEAGGVQGRGEQHSFMDHVNQDVPCPQATWEKVERRWLENLASRWCHFWGTGGTGTFFCLKVQSSSLQLALHGDRVHII